MCCVDRAGNTFSSTAVAFCRKVGGLITACGGERGRGVAGGEREAEIDRAGDQSPAAGLLSRLHLSLSCSRASTTLTSA